MIGIYICPNCSLPSIRPLGEKTDEHCQCCPSCGAVMDYKGERLDRVERKWMEDMRKNDLP
jgi:hypothetical protein